MREGEDLDEIFTVQELRKVTENLTVNHKRVIYVLEDTVENRRLCGHHVTIYEHEDGALRIGHAGRPVRFRAHACDDYPLSASSVLTRRYAEAASGRGSRSPDS